MFVCISYCMQWLSLCIDVGLSRTCEIFGAAQLVIANKKVLEDPVFLSLSVTSEKWLSIREARQSNPTGTAHDFDMYSHSGCFVAVHDLIITGACCRYVRVPNCCQTAGFYPYRGGANS